MRLPDWRERLQAELAAADGQRFAYGTTDCCQLAARCVTAITGVDHLPKFGGYDRRRAKEILRAHGGLAGIVSHALGPPGPPNHAREGDVVMGRIAGRDAVGICLGYSCAFPTRRGLARHALALMTASWPVD